MQVFNVQGMSCGHCVKAITQALQAKDPAASVRVDLAAKGSRRRECVDRGSSDRRDQRRRLRGESRLRPNANPMWSELAFIQGFLIVSELSECSRRPCAARLSGC